MKIPVWVKNKNGKYKVFPRDLFYEEHGGFYARYTAGCHCPSCNAFEEFLPHFEQLENGLWKLKVEQ